MDTDKHEGSRSEEDGCKFGSRTTRLPSVLTTTPTPIAKGSSALNSGKRQSSQRGDSAGIKNLVDRFNLTCQWVTSEIVRTQDIDMRVKVVEKFIRIAHTCYNHSNFSSLIQLMLGLQAHSVSRLSQTWARVRAQETRIMHDLVEFTSPFHNWKHLRDAMKNIADEWGGSSGGIATLIPPAPEKLTATSEGITFFSIKTSRVRTTESAKDLEVSTATMPSLPSSYISNQQSRRRGSAAPTLPSTPSLGGKGKDREQDRHLGEKGAVKSAQQGGCIPFLGMKLDVATFSMFFILCTSRPI
ncbi:ras guanine nucleotide exchange factor domain-containing protein [Dissophora ornata]|nr:ras guanine nucleotide exchange factor domain-containing protein [Dissophora ornata]